MQTATKVERSGGRTASKAKAPAESRERTVARHLGLVYHVAQKMARFVGTVDVNDLLGAGTLGLMQAVEKFSPERGVSFSTFAVPRIRGAILDDLRKQNGGRRLGRRRGKLLEDARRRLESEHLEQVGVLEIADQLGIGMSEYWEWRDDAATGTTVSLDATANRSTERAQPLADFVEDTTSLDFVGELESASQLSLARRLIAELPERDRRAVELYYVKGWTMGQIGREFGVSEGRICQIVQRAIGQVRGRARKLAVGHPRRRTTIEVAA